MTNQSFLCTAVYNAVTGNFCGDFTLIVLIFQKPFPIIKLLEKLQKIK